MAPPREKKTSDGLSGAYRAVWRWHFYAGLLVMPFLMLLALTGGAYLFRDEIDHAVYRRMIEVPVATQTASPDDWIGAAAQAGRGRAASVLMPERPDQAVRFRIDRPDGTRRTVFVDPHTARVTGVTDFGGVMELIKSLHSLTFFGPVMNILVEVVAGWTIVLFATGLYLWWPRRRQAGVVALSATDVRRRPFWRDLHALTGLYVGGVILFLAVTGMPWSAVWGDRIMDVVKTSGLGRPAAPVAGAWQRAGHADHPDGAGWTMEGMVLPAHDHAAMAGPLSGMVERADAARLPRPYMIAIPAASDTTWTVTAQVKRVQDSRALYIDPSDHRIVADIGFSQFGAGAKAIEWGIYTHQGTQFGSINRWIMLAGCIGIWLLAISGMVMWWTRRPPSLSARRLGAPTAPDGLRLRVVVLGIVVPLGLIYPLTGLSLIAALLLDRLLRGVFRSRPATR
ncbi:MAG: PepSY-associated TM helix domain-containing protein [Brevundimonas sp.]